MSRYTEFGLLAETNQDEAWKRLRKLVRDHNGNMTTVAQEIGLSKVGLWRLLKRHPQLRVDLANLRIAIGVSGQRHLSERELAQLALVASDG